MNQVAFASFICSDESTSCPNTCYCYRYTSKKPFTYPCATSKRASTRNDQKNYTGNGELKMG